MTIEIGKYRIVYEKGPGEMMSPTEAKRNTVSNDSIKTNSTKMETLASRSAGMLVRNKFVSSPCLLP